MKKKVAIVKWYDQRWAALLLGLAAWAVAYWLVLMALDTARTLYYLAFFILIVAGLNRFVKAARGR